MEEPVFLQESDVLVTKTRFSVPGQTYAINGVTSVAAHREDPKRWPAVVAIVVGVVVALAGFSPFNMGVVLAGVAISVVGYLWFKALKPTFHVVLTTSAGEKNALSTKDGVFTTRVIEALHKALVARG